jgi:hypothetical protein
MQFRIFLTSCFLFRETRSVRRGRHVALLRSLHGVWPIDRRPQLGGHFANVTPSVRTVAIDSASEVSMERKFGQQHSELVLTRYAHLSENVLERRSHVSLGEVEAFGRLPGRQPRPDQGRHARFGRSESEQTLRNTKRSLRRRFLPACDVARSGAPEARPRKGMNSAKTQ